MTEIDRETTYPWSDGTIRAEDPTYGRIDRDIQWIVYDMHPSGLAQTVAIENTLQEQRTPRRRRQVATYGSAPVYQDTEGRVSYGCAVVPSLPDSPAADGIRTQHREQEHTMNDTAAASPATIKSEQRPFLAVQDHPVDAESIMLDLDILASVPTADREEYLERLNIRELRIALGGIEGARNEHAERINNLNDTERMIRDLLSGASSYGLPQAVAPSR